MKKILFGITSLTLGGAERVLVDLANELCEKYDITIFTIYSNGELEKQLSKKVKLKTLYNKQYNELSAIQKKIVPLKVLLNKNKIYKQNIKDNYDVEIAFLEGPITRLFSVRNENTKKIAWIHNDISLVFGSGLKAKIKRKTDNKIYEQYNKLVFVSEDNKEKFEKVYNLKNEKYVIYNYINSQTVIKKSEESVNVPFDSKDFNILTVARLVEQKAIDRLVRIHTNLIKQGMNHKIYVIGDGPERENIEKLIKENNVQNTFILLGSKENPYPYIKAADCFALLSNYEGYPMVLLEAQILEKFIVITNTAARETLQNYDNKMILENNEEKIYGGLSEIIKNKEKYVKNSSNTHKYDNSEIIAKIESLINK